MNHFLVQYLKPECSIEDVSSMLKTHSCLMKPVSRKVTMHCSDKGFEKMRELFGFNTDEMALSLEDYDVKIVNDLESKDVELSLEFEGIPEQMRGKVEQSLPENWD